MAGLALVSGGCCNKLLQTWWLKTYINAHTVLEARSPKPVSLGWNQAGSRAQLPPEAPGEDALWLFRVLVAATVLGQELLTPPSPCPMAMQPLLCSVKSPLPLS